LTGNKLDTNHSVVLYINGIFYTILDTTTYTYLKGVYIKYVMYVNTFLSMYI